MNRNDDDWCHYSGMPSPKAYEKLKCEWCDKPMTEEDHNFCDICDECREENENEQRLTKIRQQNKTTRA